MTTSASVVDLYNRLVDYGRPTTDEGVVRLYIQAMALVRSHRQDFAARVALARAQLMLGLRDEALTTIDLAYGLRLINESAILEGLSHLYWYVGVLEKSDELDTALLSVTGRSTDAQVLTSVAAHALFAGNVERLKQIAELPDGIAARQYLERLQGTGLDQHIERQQEIVNTTLAGHTVWADTGSFQEPAAYIDLTYYVVCDGPTRREMDRKISDRLYAYYSGTNISPGLYSSHICPNLISAEVRHLLSTA